MADSIATMDLIADAIRQLDRLAERLAARVPPGHPDYISKSDASRWAATLAKNLESGSSSDDAI